MKVIGTAAIIALLGFGSWQVGGAVWIHGKAVLAQILLERAWELRLIGVTDSAPKPWPWADTAPIGRLQVPHLGIDQIILAGASGRSLAFGPGHLSGTALPGTAGHSIVSGHRDTHFTFLQDLATDDEVSIQRDDGQTVRYRVTGHQVVDARKARFAEAPDMTVVSLVTCYPFNTTRPNGPLRYVVFAEALEDHKTGR
ncbi:MAG: class GN sortase [Alphaproteobacteria bacterium]|nr:class GN sortase [Alphaproteobacteria bacterium]